MGKTYSSFKEIEQDLRKLELQKQIAFEEIKLLKSDFKEDIQPHQLVSTVLSAIKRYSILYLIKKIFFR